MKPFDITKPFRTRDGREARVFISDSENAEYPFIGAVHKLSGWHSTSWTRQGEYLSGCNSGYNLVNTLPRHKRTLWMNVYEYGQTAWNDRCLADQQCSSARLACLKLELDFEEGEGLEDDAERNR